MFEVTISPNHRQGIRLCKPFWTGPNLSSNLKINEMNRYEIDYITLFIYVLETCDSLFSWWLEFSCLICKQYF